MYTKTIPYKDYFDNVRNEVVYFNLDEREVFKLLVELQAIFKWLDSIQGIKTKTLDTAEVVEFYTNFEEVLLSAWGQPSEDGRYFDKTNKYKFEQSALFAACMRLFVSDPQEAAKLLEAIMPKGLDDLVRQADEKLAEIAKNPNTEAELRAEIERLKAAQTPPPVA